MPRQIDTATLDASADGAPDAVATAASITDDSTVDAKSAITDVSGVTTKGKIASGP